MDFSRIVIKPLEVLAGRPYPDVVPMLDRYDDDAALIQGAGEERRAFCSDVLRMQGIRNGLGFIAGQEFRPASIIRQEATQGGAQSMYEVDMSVHAERIGFAKGLVALRGLRNGSQR